MGGVLGRHAMLHGRPEVYVEYGEEEQAVDDQGDEDESHGNGLMESRLSRGDHMITYRARHACIIFMYNLQGLVYIYKSTCMKHKQPILYTYKKSAYSTHVLGCSIDLV